MLVIPAIDIRGGRCVRLVQGRMDAETIYSEDPIAVACKWQAKGATLIHLVDLDGAVDGTLKNGEVIKGIIKAIDIDVQIGGGIRDLKSARYYLAEPHVKRIIIGTLAYSNPPLVQTLCSRYPGRIAMGIDAKKGMVAVRGWVEVTEKRALDLAWELRDIGISCIIYTDIARDGMLSGPNIDAIREMVEALDMEVIASGGISGIRDIESLKGTGVAGVIIGKALYTGDVDLKEAIAAGA